MRVPISIKQYENETDNKSLLIISDIVTCVKNPCRALIPNLRPSIDYQFWVKHLKHWF